MSLKKVRTSLIHNFLYFLNNQLCFINYKESITDPDQAGIFFVLTDDDLSFNFWKKTVFSLKMESMGYSGNR